MSTTQSPYRTVHGRVDAYHGYIALGNVRDALTVGQDGERVHVGVGGVYFPVYVDAYHARLVPVVDRPVTLLNGTGHDNQWVGVQVVRAGMERREPRTTPASIDAVVTPRGAQAINF